MEIGDLTLFVTSICGMKCVDCCVSHQMESDNKYHMSLEEIKNLIYVMEKSEYQCSILLGGGEPLLWNNLIDGLKLLRESSAIQYISMNSTVVHGKITPELMELIDAIHISKSKYNEQKIIELKKLFPNATNRYGEPILRVVTAPVTSPVTTSCKVPLPTAPSPKTVNVNVSVSLSA